MTNRNAFRACGNKQVSSNTVDLIEFSLVNRCLGQSAVQLYVFFRSHDRESLFRTFFFILIFCNTKKPIEINRFVAIFDSINSSV